MIQRISNEQLKSKWAMETENVTERNEFESYEFGFRSAESIYIPHLEKMQEEIELLESLQVLKNQKITALGIQIEEIKSGWNRTITKHEKLVKGLESMALTTDGQLNVEDVKKLLTESENQG